MIDFDNCKNFKYFRFTEILGNLAIILAISIFSFFELAQFILCPLIILLLSLYHLTIMAHFDKKIMMIKTLKIVLHFFQFFLVLVIALFSLTNDHSLFVTGLYSLGVTMLSVVIIVSIGTTLGIRCSKFLIFKNPKNSKIEKEQKQ